MPLSSIEDAIKAYARGEFLVVVDDEDRENEGDLIIAADAMTPEKMAFMIRHTSGVICAPMSDERADELDLPLMVVENTESMRTAFTVSVDLAEGTSTGISASDRSATVVGLSNPDRRRAEFARPGHIFPLRARAGGVLKRAGHTEAAVDLCALADRQPVGVLCEIVNDDGTMARLSDLEVFATEHGLQLITIADLIRHRRRHEKLVEHFGSARIPHEVRRVDRSRLRVPAGRGRARGLCAGRPGLGRRPAGPGPLRVPDRRPVGIPALRLWFPT